MSDPRIMLAAEAMARVDYAESCNGPAPTDDQWRGIWEMGYSASARARYVLMARAVKPIFDGPNG